MFRYRSADHWIDVFRETYGPTLKAFEALDARGKAALTEDLKELIGDFNASRRGDVVIPSEYLEVVIEKR